MFKFLFNLAISIAFTLILSQVGYLFSGLPFLIFGTAVLAVAELIFGEVLVMIFGASLRYAPLYSTYYKGIGTYLILNSALLVSTLAGLQHLGMAVATSWFMPVILTLVTSLLRLITYIPALRREGRLLD